MSPIPPKELAEALLGTIFMAVGIGASALSAMRVRARDRSLLWFGLFAAVYGLRLTSYSSAIHELSSLSSSFWDSWTAFLSYVILVPMALLAEAFVGPGWKGTTRLYVHAATAGVVICITIDIATGRPGAAMVLNQALVVVGILLLAAHLLPRWREARGSVELGAVIGSGAPFAMIGSYETFSIGSVLSADFDLEPFALLLFVCAVGYYAASRVFETERQLSVLASELDMARQIQQSILPRDLHGENRRRGSSGARGRAGPRAAIDESHIRGEARTVVHHRRLRRGRQRGPDNHLLERGAPSGHHRARRRHAGAVVHGRHDARVSRRAIPRDESGIRPPGERLLLYTDGLIEAPAPEGGAFFGDQALRLAMAAGVALPVDAFADSLLERLSAWAAPRGGSLPDDVTFVVVDHER